MLFSAILAGQAIGNHGLDDLARFLRIGLCHRTAADLGKNRRCHFLVAEQIVKGLIGLPVIGHAHTKRDPEHLDQLAAAGQRLGHHDG